MAELEISALRKRFAGNEVIHGLDFVIPSGEFCALVGPSGCGKSVLLRLIAGLEDPTAGRVRLAGRDITALAPHSRDIAMVFQDYALYPHLTVAGNMGIGLREAGLSRADTDAAVATAAGLLSLTPYLHRRPSELSGGQRQRVAIGRAIVRKPSLFLFDEPLSNLDAALRLHMRLELAQLHRELGRTTIHVTHDQTEAMTLADRIVVMRDGRIEQIGRPMEIYLDPETEFVAGFIGSPKMNFIPAPGASGKTHRLGIRPEHISVSRVSGGIEGRVDHVETLGSETNLIVQTIAHGPMTVRLFGHQPFHLDERVYLDFAPDRQFKFGSDGRRLRD